MNATRYSVAGLSEAARNEDAFRQELILALVMVPLGLWFGPSGTAKALLVGSVLLVLIVELLNSAVEARWTGSRLKTTASRSGPRTSAVPR